MASGLLVVGHTESGKPMFMGLNADKHMFLKKLAAPLQFSQAAVNTDLQAAGTATVGLRDKSEIVRSASKSGTQVAVP